MFRLFVAFGCDKFSLSEELFFPLLCRSHSIIVLRFDPFLFCFKCVMVIHRLVDAFLLPLFVFVFFPGLFTINICSYFFCYFSISLNGFNYFLRTFIFYSILFPPSIPSFDLVSFSYNSIPLLFLLSDSEGDLLAGSHRGQKGSLVERQTERERAVVSLHDQHQLVTLSLDDVCQIDENLT